MFRKALIMYLIAWVLVLGMIPTDGMAMVAPSDTSATAMGSRDAMMQQIQTQLESKMVSQRLSDLGLGTDEVQARLGGLTDEQLHAVAQNLDGLQTGGDLILILAIIGAVLLLLILFGTLSTHGHH